MRQFTTRERENLRVTSPTLKKEYGRVNLSAANSVDHEMIKSLVCYILKLQKKLILTEVEFMTGGRADVVNFTDGIIIEILCHEPIESFETHKKQIYPQNFEIVGLSVAEDGIDLANLARTTEYVNRRINLE